MSGSGSAKAPEHFNSTGCIIKHAEGKGRGVFASRAILRDSVIEISPVLLFGQQEYREHGRYTALDHYVFKWPDGRMALALGLGSIFNHSDVPNISFLIDTSTESIRYKTVQNIAEGDELCIFYGHNLWFEAVGLHASRANTTAMQEPDDGWGGLSRLDDVISEGELPFERLRPPPEEETLETIKTVEAWALDVLNPRALAPLLKWIKRYNLDDEFGHLKRIRKQGDLSSLVITGSQHTIPPWPEELEVSEPYLTVVPASSALTATSWALKNTLWPTVFTPSRKDEPEPWTRGKVQWSNRAASIILKEAQAAQNRGELPIAAYVPVPYEAEATIGTPSLAADTRQSTNHPLRHAVLNVIRKIADQQGEETEGRNYLLTSLTLFVTHEPCIMCSMALLHSRVKEVVYLFGMDQTGGCGGSTCLPWLPPVNHRFGIFRWKTTENRLPIDRSIDA